MYVAQSNDAPQWWRDLGPHASNELYRQFSDVISPEGIREWLAKPNDAFGGKIPSEMIRAGDLEPLQEMIYRLGSGEPG